MEEKTIIALAALVLVFLLQIVAWVMGYDGTITGIVSTVFGIVIGYYFKSKSVNGS
jgi:hypothetical protein